MVDERRGDHHGDRRDLDERTRALKAFAESQAKVGGAISDLGVAIDYLITLAKWFIGLALIVGVVVSLGLGVVVWNAVTGYSARVHLLDQTAAIKRTADEVHSAVTPGQPIYEQGQREQASIVNALANENECRLRNALQGGADVPAGQSCLAIHPELHQGASNP